MVPGPQGIVNIQEGQGWTSPAQAQAAVHRVEFFFLREASALLSRPFSGLYKTHPGFSG